MFRKHGLKFSGFMSHHHSGMKVRSGGHYRSRIGESGLDPRYFYPKFKVKVLGDSGSGIPHLEFDGGSATYFGVGLAHPVGQWRFECYRFYSNIGPLRNFQCSLRCRGAFGRSLSGDLGFRETITHVIGLYFHQISLAADSSKRFRSGPRGGFTRLPGLFDLLFQITGLPLYSQQSKPGNDYVNGRDIYDDPFWLRNYFYKPWTRFILGIVLSCGSLWFSRNSGVRLVNHDMYWWDWPICLAAIFFACYGFRLIIFGHLWPHRTSNDQQYQETQEHTENVSQKRLTSPMFSYYNNYMANVLPIDKQVAIISSLCEGSSIRSIERITGVHRDTIMRLGVKVGHGCTALMDAKMRNLDCKRLEMDEIWGFIGKKDRHVRPGDDPTFGNVWTYCAIDADTKLVPAFRVAGDRDVKTTTAFVMDVAERMKNRLQISTDGLKAYVDAIGIAFDGDVDYGQIIKTYGTETSVESQRRYSAPKITDSEKKAIFGRPDFDLISTSYVERLNATTRLHMKRLARLTHAFSKKRENFEAAVGLHFAYYNFVRRHNTLRCTPAMEAGVERSFWSVADLVEASV